MRLTANSEKVDKNQLILTFLSYDFVNVLDIKFLLDVEFLDDVLN